MVTVMGSALLSKRILVKGKMLCCFIFLKNKVDLMGAITASNKPSVGMDKRWR